MSAARDEVQFCLFPSEYLAPLEPAHTPNHEDCPACELEEHRAMADPDKLRRLHLSAVAEFWLDTVKTHLRARTFYGYKLHVKNLNRFLGETEVRNISIGKVRCYVRARATNEGKLWHKDAGASIINHEIVTLQQILELAGEWKKIAPLYKRLPTPRRKKPKVMSDEEEVRLFAVAASNPDWRLAYLMASIGVNTGAVGSELRNLTLGDLHLNNRTPGFIVQVETAKNEYRGRWVPLNPTGLRHLKECVAIANEKGSFLPTHYLFPFRICRGRYDATRPATPSMLRRQWKDMVEAADLPHITPHCMRHQHATISLESGESEFTVAKRLGHKNPTMLRELYGHGREDIQAQAVAAIDPSVRFGPKSAGFQKVHVIRRA